MTRRTLVTGLVSASLYMAVLGAPSPAQAPTPSASADSSPAATATAADPAPTQAATEAPTQAPTQAATEAPTQAPTQAPTEAPTSAPTETATPGDTPTPFPSPVQTTLAPAATAGAAPTATASPALGLDLTRSKHRRRHSANSKDGGAGSLRSCNGSGELVGVVGGSPSSVGSGCAPATAPRADSHEVVVPQAPKLSNGDGTPAPTNPSFSLSTPGPAKIGVPNFFIDKFRIPPFLLPIYQAAGMQYGIRWEILAGINEIETDYGRNLNVSSAGAVGWMQFMPATWAKYGVDANRDGLKDPYNPVDAIFAAARYLKAAGGDTDIRRAIFAYNHADWYVDSVLMRAQVVGGLPSDLVGSLTGLTQGRFPVVAKSTYAGALTAKDRRRHGRNAAVVVESHPQRKGIKIFSRAGAAVIAVNDGKVVKIGRTKRLGRFVQLQDVYGNTYTYGHLGKIARTYPAPKPQRANKPAPSPKRDAHPTAPATTTTRVDARLHKGGPPASGAATADASAAGAAAANASTAAAPAAAGGSLKQRLFAHPERPAARAAGGDVQLAVAQPDPSSAAPLGLDKRDFRPRPLKRGVSVLGGTVLGRIGRISRTTAPHLLFEIRPAGRGAPRIDPKPILDGWKLLESTAIYRAKGKSPFFGTGADEPSIGQIMLMSKEALAQRVVHDPRIELRGCEPADVRSGAIDRRVLATLEFLASSGLKPTVSALRCDHGTFTSSGNVSEHSTGDAVDIAAINGIPILGHQGPGSIADLTIQRLLTLQGTMKPHQIISLMTFDGADNTLALPDHANHIHIGFRPLYGSNRKAARQIDQILKPGQWIKLIDRLGHIDNPVVREQPSKFALKDTRRAARGASE